MCRALAHKQQRFSKFPWMGYHGTAEITWKIEMQIYAVASVWFKL